MVEEDPMLVVAGLPIFRLIADIEHREAGRSSVCAQP